MASTHINHLKDYYERVDRFPGRPNALSIGDSWFQYPLRFYPDLQTRLSSDDLFGRRINFLDDSYPGRDAKDVPRMIRSWRDVGAVLQDRGPPFSLILLSLGGNDVIGRDFVRHLSDGSGSDVSPWPWSANVPDEVRQWIRLGELAATFDKVAASYRAIVAMRDARRGGARGDHHRPHLRRRDADEQALQVLPYTHRPMDMETGNEAGRAHRGA